MKVYCISGIGADGRVFDTLQIDAEKITINWEPTTNSESLKAYAKKLSRQIDTNEKFVLLGVSYGGMLAIEMNKFITPMKTILISSVVKPKQIPLWIRLVGKTGLINLIPTFMFTVPTGFLIWYFGIKDDVARNRIREILKNIDRKFTKQSIRKLMTWHNDFEPDNIVCIHGDQDRLLPANPNVSNHMIKNGGHFMIVQRAAEISRVVNQLLRT